MNINQYFKLIEEKTKEVYVLANKARKKGFDPERKVEIPLAISLAERAAGLISIKYPQLNNPKLIKRIAELEVEYGKLDPAVCLSIAEEIAKERFCKFKDLLEAIDAGIRFSFAYYTLGVVVPPLEGLTHYELKKRKDNGKEYFCVYYSGPIRAAGTTAGAFSLVIVDYLRKKFGFAKYDPTDIEKKRIITEVYDYHDRITNLQYLAKEEELNFLLDHCPLQIDGLPSEDKEVSNYKDLDRIEANRLRNGMCLVMSESLAQKAPKILRFIKKLREQGFDLDDWQFLEEYVELKHKLEESGKEKKSTATYIKDIVAGRPVFSHPSEPGGFRLVYGRTRDNGFSAMAVHPATMGITDGFLAFGTQIKTEKPTKGAAVGVCDSIDGPIIKLKDGSVKRVRDKEEALKLYPDVAEIIYLGDILVPYADFLNRNANLEKPGYVEQYWNQHLKRKSNLNLNPYDISIEQAVELSNKYQIPLHPSYIFYWNQISNEDFFGLLDWIARGRFSGKLILPYGKNDKERFEKGKRALEILGVEHEVTIENVVMKESISLALLLNLGIEGKNLEREINLISEKIKGKEKGVLELMNDLSSFIIKDKSGTFIGARMGRPEKAKLRKLIGSPHVLFPVGDEGGRLRSVQEACEVGTVRAEWPLYFCQKCQKESIFTKCIFCGEDTEKRYYCFECKKVYNSPCEEHDSGIDFSRRRLNIKDYMDNAIQSLNMKKFEVPVLIKGVRGTSSGHHIVEHLAKGILRARFGLNVNKDGTIRYDVTEMPITHFKPSEVGTSIAKLKELGYVLDRDGKSLEREDQILELFPHDVILPACPDSLDEPADKVFLNITHFIDSLLKDFYKVDSFYNASKPEDLVGHLVACMAPHNAAGVIGRIVGFSKTQTMLATPYMHAGMRRDCDGDEAAFMLLGDCLINFSKHYLPAHRGATQDAPLVLNAKLNPGEVDDQIFDFDVVRELPLELYEAAEQGKHSSEVRGFIELIKNRVDENKPAFKDVDYDYETSDINGGILCSSYKSLPTMKDKVDKVMELTKKLRAAKTGDVARLIIDRHFIRDIRGNLRKFATQQFRCVKCNEKFRRPPLSGICACGGKIIFTISYGSIIKYLEPAWKLATEYDVPVYIRQNLELTKKYIESIFGREKEKQESIQKWF